MSHDYSDEKDSIIVPGGKKHDFTAAKALISKILWSDINLSAFKGTFSEDFHLDVDNPQWLRDCLSRDLHRFRTRLYKPDKYIRQTQNYDTYGYGLEWTQVGEHVLMDATQCDTLVAAGEVEGKAFSDVEASLFQRLRLAGQSTIWMRYSRYRRGKPLGILGKLIVPDARR